MKIYFISILSALLLFSSCDKDEQENTCGENPLENILWLKELVDNENKTDDTSGLEIIQYTYKNDTVFSVNHCINNCSDAMTIVYDCDKNVICEFGGIAGLNTCPDFESEAMDKKTLFSTATNAISQIVFQNSFGFCVGYCISSIEIVNQQLLFKSDDWTNDLPTKKCSYNLTSDQWATIQNDIDLERFFNMDDSYGCPDCADGGASFIEIKRSNSAIKKVAFEYNNPPNEIENYANMLQEMLNKASKCDKSIVEDLCDKAVIINEDLYNSAEASPIKKISIEGNCMQITHLVCAEENYIDSIYLIDSGLVMESLPVQRNLKFSNSIDYSDVFCNTVEVITSFDISALADWDAPEVILNIEGFAEQITYVRNPICGDPNVSCIPVQEIDAKKLVYMLDEIKAIAESIECESADDWKITPIGSKACGGPQGFLAYSNKIDEVDFLEKIEAYRVAEENYNKTWGVVSTCDVPVMPSSVVCENGKPEFVYN